MIFLKCKIRFIYVGFNCKRKKWGKKCLEICAIKGGGVGRLMANTILNFHFDYPHPSLSGPSLLKGAFFATNPNRAVLVFFFVSVKGEVHPFLTLITFLCVCLSDCVCLCVSLCL